MSITWEQNTDDVIINVPVAEDVKGRDIDFEVHPKRLSLKIKGETVLQGDLSDVGAINLNECFWTIEDEGGRHVAINLAKKEMGYMNWAGLLEEEVADESITNKVFLQIAIDGEMIGKVAIGLFGNVVPKTVENFRQLCTGEAGVGKSGVPLTYKASKFHRIIPGFMCQAGDFTSGDGRGGESIYGERFDDENFRVKHKEAGYVAMANAGPGTNGSQFYVISAATPHLDGRHVVFGKVLAGMELMRRVEAVGSDSGAPSSEVEIVDCGELDIEDDLKALMKENHDLQSDRAEKANL